MRTLTFLILISLYGCQYTTAQHIDETIKEDKEFESLLSKVSENNKNSAAVQEGATKAQTKIVNQAVSQIVSLKAEVSSLKSELSNAKSKLDSNLADTGVKFNLLPVSNR
jgi:predicted  nucleic acid-binding Zn-ribbon protein